jgi:predicted nucleic acid-binding protein
VIVLDTNVVSELMRPSPAAVVRDWVQARNAHEIHVTSVTLAETRHGIQRLPGGRRKELLRTAAADVFAMFHDRILSFDDAAATQYALIVTARDVIGQPIGGFDAQIAAICRVRGATLATRDVKGFTATGIELIDPWHTARSPTP